MNQNKINKLLAYKRCIKKIKLELIEDFNEKINNLNDTEKKLDAEINRLMKSQ